jgi:zinc protease
MISPISFPLDQYRLANGLTVLLHHSDACPVVAVEVMYHVGSKNEQPGLTGLAHLFEHMMFKGSENVADGEHFKRLQELGAEVNGSTTEDRTTYYEVLPPEHLETALYLEADRMGRLLPALTEAKLQNQRDVVKNERRQTYENQPYGLAHETIAAALFPSGHPYSWPVIGSMQDLDNASLANLRQFFLNHYSPSNAVLTIGGSFDEVAVHDLVAKYFGPLPDTGTPANPAFPPAEPAIPQQIVLRDKVSLPRVYLVWRTAPWCSDDDIMLDTVTDILGDGKGSRLHRALVIEQKLAQSVSAYQHGLERDGMLVVVATARPGIPTDRLIASIQSQINYLFRNGIARRELQKSLNTKETDLLTGVAAVRDRVHKLALFHTLTGSARNLFSYLDRFSTLEQATVVARTAEFLERHPLLLEILPLEAP